MPQHRIYRMAWKDLYPNYINKAERKGRTREEVDEIVRWLTGYSQSQLDQLATTPSEADTNGEATTNTILNTSTNPTLEEFFANAPRLNEARAQITGVICGVRIEEIEDDLMRELRYLDKLIDELARGRAMAKILRD